MGATAALKLRVVAENLETILALEAFCAAQGIDFRKRVLGSDKKLGVGTRGIYSALREKIPFILVDEYMKGHIESACDVIRNFPAAI